MFLEENEMEKANENKELLANRNESAVDLKKTKTNSNVVIVCACWGMVWWVIGNEEENKSFIRNKRIK